MSLTKLPLSMMSDGTDGNIISFDASGNPVAVATGSSGQLLTSAGAGSQPAFGTVTTGFTQPDTQAATSGASKVFGSIPSGTKMIVINYFDISSNNAGTTGALRLVLGDGGGLESSGYISMRAQLRSSANVIFDDTANFELSDHLDVSSSFRGSCICTLQDAATFRWIAQWQTMDTSNTATVNVGCGSKALSAELTQIALQTSDAFDDSDGSISIMFQ